jgi:hypothetical protein
MLTSEDYRDLANRYAQLAIACRSPSVARSLLALASNFMSLAVEITQPAAANQQQMPDSFDGFGD